MGVTTPSVEFDREGPVCDQRRQFNFNGSDAGRCRLGLKFFFQFGRRTGQRPFFLSTLIAGTDTPPMSFKAVCKEEVLGLDKIWTDWVHKM